MNIKKFIGLNVVIASLAGCGGGSDNASPGVNTDDLPTPPQTGTPTDFLQGIAASGAALANASVEVIDAEGTAADQEETGADGSFSVDVTGLEAPFMIKVTANGREYYSWAREADDGANVNQLTNAALQMVLDDDLSGVFDSWSSLADKDLTEELYGDGASLGGIQLVVASLAQKYNSAGVALNFNFFTSAFTAGSGTGFDAILDLIPNISVVGDGITAVITITNGGGTEEIVFDSTHSAAVIEIAGTIDFAGSVIPCPAGTVADDSLLSNTRVCVLSGVYNNDLSLLAGNAYLLKDKVEIGQSIDHDGGAITEIEGPTLSIEPGVTIIGDGSDGIDYLIINRGSNINAQGEVANPIVMTAIEDVKGEINEFEADTKAGLWGGLYINGYARLSSCSTLVGGEIVEPDNCEAQGEADTGMYGGNSDADNSGVLRYAQVKYAGFKFDEETELNGIAFQGVGSGTTLEYLQVHNNADDGVEFFGGTANVKHLVLTGNQDDSLDWTSGWRGMVQHVLIRQSVVGDRGIEADNLSNPMAATPRSAPMIANMTIIGGGSNTNDGILLRRGTGANFYNTVITGEKDCVDIDDSETFVNAGTPDNLTGNLTIVNSVAGCDSAFDEEENDEFAVSAWFVAQSGNRTDVVVDLDEIFNGANLNAVTAFNGLSTNVDVFFDDTDYVGAVKDEENDWTAGWTFDLPNSGKVITASCPSGTVESSQRIAGTLTCEVEGEYTESLTLTKGPIYLLKGKVEIGQSIDNAGEITEINGPDLTIAAGAVIVGDSEDGIDYLVINRGSDIFAEGTASDPIIMTGIEDVEGEIPAEEETTKTQLWGGLYVNGYARLSSCSTLVEGEIVEPGNCEAQGEADTGIYGGNNDADNSGVMRYIQVKYAGFAFDEETELNGIAFQGVGSGTTLEYLQVHNGSDDGVEFFGGTASVKYLVLTGNQDDSLDWTSGWRGLVQHVVIRQSVTGDRGIEADNLSNPMAATPRSAPQIANITIIGQATTNDGMLLRRGTGANFFNAVIVGQNDCIDIDDSETFVNAGTPGSLTGNLTMVNSIALCDGEFDEEAGDEFSVATWFTSQTGNADDVVVDLDGVVNGSNVNEHPAFSDLSTVDSFFDNTDYVGAVKDSANDWTAGWTFGL